jgi:hypothetical protein
MVTLRVLAGVFRRWGYDSGAVFFDGAQNGGASSGMTIQGAIG